MRYIRLIKKRTYHRPMLGCVRWVRLHDVQSPWALFNGLDAAGKHGLWESDGTTAGTHEITGIKGANSNGVAPSDLTVLSDGKNLMDAVTSSNQVAGSIGQLVQAIRGFGHRGAGTA